MLTSLLFAAALAIHAPYIDTLTINTGAATTEYSGRLPTVDWRQRTVYMNVTTQQRFDIARDRRQNELERIGAPRSTHAPRSTDAPTQRPTWTFKLAIDGEPSTVTLQCDELIALGHGATVTATANCD